MPARRWTPAPNGRITTAATRSLEIAAAGVTPNSRISIGVISAPPPAPVMPTSSPMIALPRTMYGSMCTRADRDSARPRAGPPVGFAREGKQIARRLAGQHPGLAVGPDQPAPGQLGQGGGHGRPARGDQIGQHGVGQAQSQHGAVAAHPAPARGQVPEQHVQPDVDPGLVDDRHVDRQVLGALERPGDQAPPELGVLGQALLELAVERGDARGQDDRSSPW